MGLSLEMSTEVRFGSERGIKAYYFTLDYLGPHKACKWKRVILLKKIIKIVTERVKIEVVVVVVVVVVWK